MPWSLRPFKLTVGVYMLWPANARRTPAWQRMTLVKSFAWILRQAGKTCRKPTHAVCPHFLAIPFQPLVILTRGSKLRNPLLLPSTGVVPNPAALGTAGSRAV